VNVGLKLDELKDIDRLKLRIRRKPLDFHLLDDIDSVQFKREDFEEAAQLSNAIRYVLARKESKSQF